MKKIATIITGIYVLIALSGCMSGGNLTTTQKSAITGAAVGAGIGAMSNRNDRGKGALIGAAAGGLIGGVASEYGQNQGYR